MCKTPLTSILCPKYDYCYCPNVCALFRGAANAGQWRMPCFDALRGGKKGADFIASRPSPQGLVQDHRTEGLVLDMVKRPTPSGGSSRTLKAAKALGPWTQAMMDVIRSAL